MNISQVLRRRYGRLRTKGAEIILFRQKAQDEMEVDHNKKVEYR